MQQLKDLARPLLNLCRDAGAVIKGHYFAPGADRFEAKGDETPLTRADLDSHDLLVAGLERLTPGVPILSEESAERERRQRLDWTQLWLVDPLDGTKEFLARTGEFTINIALVSSHRPELGLLYLPMEECGFLGIPGLGAWCYRVSDAGWQSESLQTSALIEGRPLRLLASRRHRGSRLSARIDWLQRHWGELQRINSGSALKFCQMAAGEGDFYPRYSPCSEWDVAAGQALVEGAGGAVLGLDGQPLQYNRRKSLLSPDFYALADPGHALWQRLFDQLDA